MISSIDTTFDFRSDSGGKDPDAYSATLRAYHKILWSKPLPGGAGFNLDDTTTGAYLHHKSALGEFFLTSDTLNQSYGKNRVMSDIWNQLPDEVNEFRVQMYFIGNMIIFPGRQIGGNMTINQARGCRIGDRCDLTLECIRLHYHHQPSPLAKELKRYADFFDLFGDFQGYVDFFLLHDLVTDDCAAVKFFLPLADFKREALYPSSADAFRTYLHGAKRFIEARNRRVIEYTRGKK